jgi:multidrug resistance efflux pump
MRSYEHCDIRGGNRPTPLDSRHESAGKNVSLSDPVEDLHLPMPEPVQRSPRGAYALLGSGLLALTVLAYFAFRGAPTRTTAVEGTALVATDAGVVSAVAVQAGQTVSAGDLILAFDDQAEQAELAAAQAALQELANETKESDLAVAITPPEGVTGRIVPIGPLPAGPPAGTPSVKPLPAPKGTPESPLPAIGAASRGSVLEEAIRDTEAELAEIRTKMTELEHQIEQARVAQDEAERNAAAAKVIAQQRKQQADKMRMLLREGAVSQLETSRAEVQYASAQGGYEAAEDMVNEAIGKVRDLEAELAKGALTLPTLEKSLEITKNALKNAPTPPLFTPPQTPVREVATAPVPKPARVQPTPLPNLPAKVEVDKGGIREADEQMTAAKERVDKAEAAILARRISATRAGTIVKVLVKPGDSVQAGQVLVIIR